MKRNIKKELDIYFAAPKPRRKQDFLRQATRKQRMQDGLLPMLMLQCHYISPVIWLVSILFFALSLSAAYFIESYLGFSVFALVPFLVMVSVTESMRSYQYGMQELEMSTRFSLKTVILMRLLVLGGGNMIVLSVSSFLMKGQVSSAFVYMFTAYFLTAAGSLWIVRNFAGKESVYICFGFSLLVTMAVSRSMQGYSFLYAEQYFGAWFLAMVFFAALSVREGRALLKRAEALA